MYSFRRNSIKSIYRTASFERERGRESQCALLSKLGLSKKKRWMYTRRAACRKTSGTKLSTPDKKAHARKTHSPARDKRRARNKTAMRRARVPASLIPPPPIYLSATFRKQKMREKPSEKMNYFPRKTRSRSTLRLGGEKGGRAKGRPRKGQRG